MTRSRQVMLAALAAIAVAVLAVAAYGDDDDSGDTGLFGGSGPPVAGTPEQGTGASTNADPAAAVLAASGHAPAATGAGLDRAPGEPGRVPLEGFGETAIAITGPGGTVHGWCVLLALSDEQRQRGLMEVTDLAGYAGMLFVFSSDTGVGFYMRNTPMPLTIGWFDADGELVSTADMDPCEDAPGCPTYNPGATYRFALEVPQGSLDDLGATPGSRLAIGGPCADRPGG